MFNSIPSTGESWFAKCGHTVIITKNKAKSIVVLITHHMAEAEEADRVIVMNDGEAAMDGTPREIFAQVERLHELGLAAPDTVELMQRLNRQGEHLPLTAITVEECADALYRRFGAEGK